MTEIINNWPWYDRMFFGGVVTMVVWSLVSTVSKLERIIKLLEQRQL
jgi:hypothetical protein